MSSVGIIYDAFIGALKTWEGLFGLSSPTIDTFTFFYGLTIGRSRVFKGVAEYCEIKDKGVVVVIQLFYNLAGEELIVLLEEMKKLNQSPALRLNNNDWIKFGYSEKGPHLAVFGILENAEENFLNRVNLLLAELPKKITEFWPLIIKIKGA